MSEDKKENGLSAEMADAKEKAETPKSAAPAKSSGVGAFFKREWPDMLRPVTVLLCICLVVSVILSVTNYFTAPIIADNVRRAANASRQELLPQAEDFEQIEGSWDGVTDAYRATNGVGYVITGTAKGYGGEVPVLVAFDADGKIAGIQISGTDESQGIGAKIEEAPFKSQFAGLPAQPLTLNTDVDQVAGATISSTAAVNAVNNAVAAYQAIGGAQS